MCLQNLMKFHQLFLKMITQDIKETKRYGHTFGWMEGRTDNVKTVYPPTNTVGRGYNKRQMIARIDQIIICHQLEWKQMNKNPFCVLKKTINL